MSSLNDSISTTSSSILEIQHEPFISKDNETHIESLEIETNTSKDKLNETVDKDLLFQQSIIYPANCLSKITFHWIQKTLIKSRKMLLTMQQLPQINKSLTSQSLYNKIQPLWYNNYQYISKHPLFKAILHANIKNIIICLTLSTFQAVIELIDITIFRYILQIFPSNTSNPLISTDISTSTDNPNSIPFTLNYLITIMILIRLVNLILFRFSDFIIKLTGTQITIQLHTLIYDKLLHVTNFHKTINLSEGKLINNIQIDANKFGEFITLCPKAFIFIFQITFYIFLLFRFFGNSFVLGFICLIILILFVSLLQKKKLNEQQLKMEAFDKRMNSTVETFNNMKEIKLCSLEKIFYKRIESKYNEELIHFKKSLMLNISTHGLYWSGCILLSALSIIFHNIISGRIDTVNIMAAIFIFNKLSSPLHEIPVLISSLQETLVALNRIEQFLYLKEYNDKQIEKLPKESNTAISISNVSFGLDRRDNIKEVILLKNIDLHINKGELVCIIGDVGSGKTNLLNAILNNLYVYYGKDLIGNIKINGKIGYVSQVPWIVNDTLRNNILFYKEMNVEKYNKVINVCELNNDIGLFEGGDMIEVGEKGIGLSCGQKMRLSIARAIYSEADIYLFDDCLSSMDCKVGMNIFNNVIEGYLQNKTRVIVVNSLKYISYADRIIYLDKGSIKWMGTPNEIQHQGFYKEYAKNGNCITQNKQMNLSNSKTEQQLIFMNNNNQIYKTIKEEKLKKQNVKVKTLWKFFQYAGGTSYLFSIIIFNLLYKLFEIGSFYFISYWITLQDVNPKQNDQYLIIYVIISFIGIIFIFLRAHSMTKGLINFNNNMHSNLLRKLLQAPLNKFHDVIPLGQILSRLGKDLDNSKRLNMVSNNTLSILFQLIGCIIICAIFNKYSVPLVCALLIFEYYFTCCFMGGVRDLSRLEANTRSPILSVFNETLNGISTIRAFQYENNFINKFYSKLDDHLKIKLFQSGGDGWVGLRLDLISFTLLSSLLLFSLFCKDYFTPQAIGLLLVYSTKLMEMLYDIINSLGMLEQLLISVERCTGFMKIPQEFPISNEVDKETKEEIITQGKIEFCDYSVKYRPEMGIVLKNLNFGIKAGEKIAVVGRSGSGKSTLSLCLSRILEAYAGKILIDGIDISKIRMNVLRENITIIPKEPTIIEGTLRDNIDPHKKFSDEQIIKVIRDVNLDYLFKEKSFNYEINESGNDLSLGERQLICIARAVLNKHKIVIINEIQTSIDYARDINTMESILKVLKDSTVITITHKIHTIMNYDKILGLANGEVVEFDTPTKLIQSQKGIFYELYKESSI